MCILEEQETFVASLSNHSVSCGSVVPCVETSRLKANNREWAANELVAASVSQRTKSKELIGEKRKESQYKQN